MPHFPDVGNGCLHTCEYTSDGFWYCARVTFVPRSCRKRGRHSPPVVVQWLDLGSSPRFQSIAGGDERW
jgi:hypothetical protein